MEEKLRILFVDDEECVLRSITRLFLDDEYEVITASSAQEGLRILEENVKPVHIVVSDYGMPGMNGVAFLGRVCKGWPGTVRMVLSGYADMHAISAAINEGEIYKFIPKPWNNDDLKISVANAAERYRLQRENALLLAELREKSGAPGGADASVRCPAGWADPAADRARDILFSLPMGVMVVDSSGNLIGANRRSAEIAGWEQTENGAPAAGTVPSSILPIVAAVTAGAVVRRSLLVNGKMCKVTAQEMAAGTAGATIVVIEEL